MSAKYVLIDFENVQPANLQSLKQYDFKVLVFVGANQTKIPYELAEAMQSLGQDGRYVKIASTGKNSLDFHIAYYIGEMAAKEPNASFHIISRDTGFDPLIAHLKKRKIRIHRAKNLADIPIPHMSAATSTEEKVSAIVKNLAGRGQSRPRKVQTLTNSIKSLFADHLSDQQLSALVKDLERRGYIVINNSSVSYQLPE
jgi:hypothetical protein